MSSKSKSLRYSNIVYHCQVLIPALHEAMTFCIIMYCSTISCCIDKCCCTIAELLVADHMVSSEVLHYPFQIRSRSRPSRFLFFGAAGHVIRIFLDMNVMSPEYLSG